MTKSKKIILVGAALFASLVISTAAVKLVGAQILGGTFCFPVQGCTGTSTKPALGQILVGNANGTYDVVATSSLGISSYATSSADFWILASSTLPKGSGVAGQVTYWGGTSQLTGSTVFIWDNTNRKFGIGTTSPYAALSVVGSTGVVANIFHATNTTATSTFGHVLAGNLALSSLIQVTGNGTSTYAKGIDLAGGCFSIGGTCVAGSGGTSDGGSKWATSTTDSTAIYSASASKIGVGTTTPQWAIQAAGTRPFLALSDTSSGVNTKHWTFSSQGGNLYISTSTDLFATGTPSALSYDSGGTFRVATSSPSIVTGELMSSIIDETMYTDKIFIREGSQLSPINGDSLNVGMFLGSVNEMGGQKTGAGVTSVNFTTRKITTGLAYNFNYRTVSGGIETTGLSIENQTGRVGVGTSSPSAKFSVHGLTGENGLFSSILFLVGSSTQSATSTFFSISNTGAVKIPAMSPGVAGDNDVCITSSTGLITDAGASTCIVSSIRFKDVVAPIKDALKKVLKLSPISYIYKNDPERKERLGLIAEEVEKVEPRLVFYEKDGVTPRGVSYEESVALLVGAIQDQQNQIQVLQKEVAKLKAEIKNK